MYLAGFSLTLVFVIARLVELMQENVNTEEEKENFKKRIKDIEDAASRANIETDITPNTNEEPTLRRRPGVTTAGEKND